MTRSRYKVLDDNSPYFITTSIVGFKKIFSNQTNIDIVLDGLRFLIEQRDVEIYAFVLMPNHIHMIAKGDSLGLKISSFKSYSARCIIDALKLNKDFFLLDYFKNEKLLHKRDREHQVWQEGFHPKLISSNDMMNQKVNYIHYNPVKAGLVNFEIDWEYSSAKFYKGDSCILPITHYGNMS